ncbi:hypothetical protein BJX64DRAFT_45696 [Aspergillus heterothallicus]
MSDPFSVSAGVVGVVSLGLTLAQGFLRYYGPWKDYDDDIRGFTTNVDGLLQTLKLLEGFLSPENELSLPSDQYRQLVLNNLTSCEEACRRLEKILTECKSSDISSSPFVRKHDWLRLKRAVYPFNKETLVTLSQLVSGLQDNLSLALQLLNGALMAQQQRMIQGLILQTSAIGIRTTKILTTVEKQALTVVESKEIVRREEPHVRSAPSMMMEPSTLRELYDQQQLINAWLRRKRRSPSSLVDQIQHYCTCLKKPRRSSRFSFSIFALHERSCPLYSDDHQVLGMAASYSFCNRFLGRSIHVVMTLARGAGGIAISQMIRAHAVVSRESPAFERIRHCEIQLIGYSPIGSATSAEIRPKNRIAILTDVRTSLLRMFCEGKAAPTDRLEDGSTLLHEVFSYNLWQFMDSWYPECRGPYESLVQFLIDAGVPLNEQDVYGRTALDNLTYKHMPFSFIRRLKPKFGMSILQNILVSGGLMTSFVSTFQGNYWSYYSVAQVARYLLPNAPEAFDISEIEMAIVTKSEASLRRCLAERSDLPHTARVSIPSDFKSLCFLCLGWPAGLSIILEWHSSISEFDLVSLLWTACAQGEVECALIILRHVKVIKPEYLSTAAQCKNIDILKQVTSAIAASRRKLQQLALRHLPQEVLCPLSVPANALLDRRAPTVYEALRKYGIEAEDPSFPDASVYNRARGEIIAFEILYDAGFTDVNQCGEDGITPLMALNDSWWKDDDDFDLGSPMPTDLSNFGRVAGWMINKGADIRQCSREGYEAIWYLAENFGLSFSKGKWGQSRVDERDIRLCVDRQHPDSIAFLSLLLTDDTRDDCVCACSESGCATLTRILRAWSPDWAKNHKTLLSVLVDEWHTGCPNAFDSDSRAKLAHQMIRYLTFEALGLTHTCHAITCMGKEGTRMDPEEVDEIREEEVSLIEELEVLVRELITKYDELGVGIYKFIFEHWRPRIDEVVPPEDEDPKERRRIRAAGYTPVEYDD